MLNYLLRMCLVTLSAILSSTPTFAECKLPVPAESIIFQADIHYTDPKIKTDPYIFVSIQGQTKKFLLDTGRNHHITWEAFAIPPGHRKQILHILNSSAEEEIAHVNIADLAGHVFVQEMGLIKGAGAKLAQKGIAGLISPQALAGKHPFLIDFEQGCFLVGREEFDMKTFTSYLIYPGRLKPNPYQMMWVPIQIGKKGDVVNIDSGTDSTALLSSLINGFPVDHQKAPEQTEDLMGKRDPKKFVSRRVNLVLNNLSFPRFSVREMDNKAEANEDKSMGRVGMDILKNFMLVVNFDQNTFYLLHHRDQARLH